jgi:hypothetical protein
MPLPTLALANAAWALPTLKVSPLTSPSKLRLDWPTTAVVLPSKVLSLAVKLPLTVSALAVMVASALAASSVGNA